MKVKNLLPFGALMPAIWMSCGQTQNTEKAAKPNIVIIFSDELQFDDISAYGGSISTPNIDYLAQNGVQFNQAYTTASMSTPSRFSLLTGQMPSRCIAESYVEKNPDNEPANTEWNTWIVPQNITIPRLLSSNGYNTGIAGKWHLGDIPSDKWPYIDDKLDLVSEELNLQLKNRQAFIEQQVKKNGGFDHAASIVWDNNDMHPVKALRFHNFGWMNKGALEFIDSAAGKDKPFFLYFTPTSIHGPNHVESLDADKSFTPDGKDAQIQKYNINDKALKDSLNHLKGKNKHRVAGMVNLDFSVKLIIEKLKEKGIWDNTIVILIADHNIEPGKATCYAKGIRVPMIIKSISNMQKGLKCNSLVQTVDILPTICEWTGIELPKNHIIDGLSLLPVLKNVRSNIRKYIFTESGYSRSISNEIFQYIALRFPSKYIDMMTNKKMNHVPSYVGEWPQGQSAIAIHSFPCYFDQNQLYNLQTDKKEQVNIYLDDTYKAVRDSMKNELTKNLASFRYKFNLDDIPFLNSLEYKNLQKTNRAYDLKSIPWFIQDHGEHFEWNEN